MESIPEVRLKIKLFKDSLVEHLLSRDIFILLVIILVGIASFGLGRLSILKINTEPIKIEQQIGLTASVVASQSIKGEDITLAQGGIIIGTKSSKKYRYPWCNPLPAESNRIIFQSIEQAKIAGYTPVANCKGLK
ncbi:MAG: hypothetical protein WCW14_00900 [Candidatus Paceibacterota bacterium]|jgi:hypothetical protein